jgi:hypothetical protein
MEPSANFARRMTNVDARCAKPFQRVNTDNTRGWLSGTVRGDHVVDAMERSDSRNPTTLVAFAAKA